MENLDNCKSRYPEETTFTEIKLLPGDNFRLVEENLEVRIKSDRLVKVLILRYE